MLLPMRQLIASLSIFDQLPQIELAVGAGQESTITAMVLRIMAPLTAPDEIKLKAFADQYQVQWWLQPKGPDSAFQFYPAPAPLQQLHYALPEFGVKMPFRPTDFTQVNHQINGALVARALRLLDAQPNERIADFFCGLGNFSLPIATRARQVVGLEGSATLIERAQQNAQANGLAGKATFSCRNLFDISAEDLIAMGRFDRFLIDPPREGAVALCQALTELGEAGRALKPARIVYVSCNPSTLARDAALLVHNGGYLLKQAGVVNMFPHTAHVESIAVFDLAT